MSKNKIRTGFLRSIVKKRGDKHYYLFDEYTESGKIIRSGIHYPLCSFDPTENVLIWADTSLVIGTSNLRKVGKLRKRLLEIDTAKYKVADKDISVLSTKQFESLLEAILTELDLELMKSVSSEYPFIHVHVIENILHDSRTEMNRPSTSDTTLKSILHI